MQSELKINNYLLKYGFTTRIFVSEVGFFHETQKKIYIHFYKKMY